MIKINKKIQAGTLIEVIVALIIILIVYGILTLFIQNISKQIGNNKQKIEAYFIIEKTFNETIQNNQFFDEEFVSNNITFTKSVVHYKNYKDLYDIQIVALDRNKKLLVEMNEIIYAKKN